MWFSFLNGNKRKGKIPFLWTTEYSPEKAGMGNLNANIGSDNNLLEHVMGNVAQKIALVKGF